MFIEPQLSAVIQRSCLSHIKASYSQSPTIHRGKEKGGKPAKLFDLEGWRHSVPDGEAHPVEPHTTAKVDTGNPDRFT